jgi:SDR family mycofactocin-dependent oxidoreductase
MAGRHRGQGRSRLGRGAGAGPVTSGAAGAGGRGHHRFDVCRQLDTVPYPMAVSEEFRETAELVEDLDRRIVASEADVRDSAAVRALVEEGVREFGRLDVVCANAGIAGFAKNTWTMTEDQWDEMIAVNLTGVWKTVKAAVPAIIEAGNGGSIVITSSTGGVKGLPGIGAHYVAAKHGVVGMMRTLANELAPHFIRVNTVHPTGVNTPMIANDAAMQAMSAAAELVNMQNALPVTLVEPVDISNALVWLTSDEARYVTGVSLPVDAGLLQR